MVKNQKAHILVVEDDESVRDLVCMMLAHLGYATTAAQNGVEALGYLSGKSDFDFVLSDINMPRMDGWELAYRIKTLNPDMPIIVLTGEDPQCITPRLSNSGIRHVLYKPLTLDHLNKAIRLVRESGQDSAPATPPL